MERYQVLYHDIFGANLREFHEKFGGREHDKVWKKLLYVCQSPLATGAAIKDVGQYSGRMRKIWVEREGHRIVWFVKRQERLVVPVWLSMVRRDRLDYNEELLIDRAATIDADYAANKTERFKIVLASS